MPDSPDDWTAALDSLAGSKKLGSVEAEYEGRYNYAEHCDWLKAAKVSEREAGRKERARLEETLKSSARRRKIAAEFQRMRAGINV